jgi:hypothetical protein
MLNEFSWFLVSVANPNGDVVDVKIAVTVEACSPTQPVRVSDDGFMYS